MCHWGATRFLHALYGRSRAVEETKFHASMLDASLCISGSKFMDLWPTITIRVTCPSWTCIDCTVILNRNTACDVLIDRLGMILNSKASFARQPQEPGRRPSNDKKNEKEIDPDRTRTLNLFVRSGATYQVHQCGLWVSGQFLNNILGFLQDAKRISSPLAKKKLIFQISKLTGGGWETK